MDQNKIKIDREKFGVYIWTSNSLMHCVPAWAYLFNKFWPYKQKVRVLGYNMPEYELPENFEYISLGVQRGPDFWSDDMKQYFSSCEHESFYLTTEDGFIVGDVDSEILDMGIKLSLSDPSEKFLKFCLTADVHRRPKQVLKDFGNFKLIKAAQHSNYRHSLSHCIWRRDRLVEKLTPGQSPWKFEVSNNVAKNDGYDIYATENKYAVHCGHGYRRGQKIKDWFMNVYYVDGYVQEPAQLSTSDIKYIEDNGWMPEL
jgi:hypothetical protein